MSSPTVDVLGETEPAGADTATAEVSWLLRRHRKRRLRHQRGEAAFMVYLALFIALLFVPPAVVFIREPVAPLYPLDASRQGALFLLLSAAILSLWWTAGQEAMVRGPIQPGAAVIDWVLRLPVHRARFLLPPLVWSFVLRGVVGGAVGVLGAALLGRTFLPSAAGGPDVSLLWQCALAGALTGVATTAVGALVVAGGLRGSPRWRILHSLCQALLLGGAALAWFDRLPEAVRAVVAWSGPWGWALQPFHAVGREAWAWPWAALGAHAALTVLLTWAALRALDRVAPEGLRERAGVDAGLRSGVWMSDHTWFQVSVTERRLRGRMRFRIRPPSRIWSLMLWRDLLGALRAPYPVLVGCLMCVLAFAVAQARLETSGTGAVVMALLPLVLLQTGAARLLGGARSDVADPRRTRYLPPGLTRGTSGLAHGLWPLTVLVPVALVTSAVGAVAGWAPLPMLGLLMALPGAVAGALCGTYRGIMPDHLSLGVETPMGSTAPLQMVGWHLSGTLGALAVTWPMSPALGTGTWWTDLLWTAVGTPLLVHWAYVRAGRALG